MSGDKKILKLEAKFGLTGYAIYVKLLEEIYKDWNFNLKDEDDLLVYSDKWRLNPGLLSQILSYCIKVGLFEDEGLRSNGIRKKLAEIEKERKRKRELYSKKSDNGVSTRQNSGETKSNTGETSEKPDKDKDKNKYKEKEKQKDSLSPFSKNGKTTFNDDWFDKHIWDPWLNKDCSREEAKEYFIEACVTHETTRDKAWLAAKGVLNYFRSRNVQEGVIMNFKTFFLESNGAKITLWANAPPN
jgi:hypothetical protein